MKIKTLKQEPKFLPVVITIESNFEITIENNFEAYAFLDMISSVPERRTRPRSVEMRRAIEDEFARQGLD